MYFSRMKKSILFISFCAAILTACNNEKPATQLTTADTLTEVEILDSEAEKFFSKDAKAEIIASGFLWSEGPLWLKDQKILIFSDVPRNTINSWSEKDSLKVYLTPSGYTDTIARSGETGSNGLFLNKEGKLVLAQHGDRRIAEMQAPLDTPKAIFKTLADKFNGKRFSSPNDVYADSKGNYYFTDPPYGLEKKENDPSKEQAKEGVYRINVDGTVEQLIDSLTRPNGIIVSNDGSKLYVANSDPARAIWAVYDIDAQGKLSNGKIFMDATPFVSKGKGLPDGLKMNHEGYIFASGPCGIWIFNPAGKHIATIKIKEHASNVALDDTESYLYITANMYLLRMKLNK
jgi:gluconolactonase